LTKSVSIFDRGYPRGFKPQVAVVVPIGHRPIDLPLLNRFLRSLEQSDFPKQYLLYVTVSEFWTSRMEGVEEAIKSGVPYILNSDNDCIVPKDWWDRWFEKLESDPKIAGILVHEVLRFAVVRREFLLDENNTGWKFVSDDVNTHIEHNKDVET
jgi:hypothetical protein